MHTYLLEPPTCNPSSVQILDWQLNQSEFNPFKFISLEVDECMWSHIEVDLEGTLSWSAFIAGLRCTLIKQHSASAMKNVSIWQAGKETQQVIKLADSPGLITGLQSKDNNQLQLKQQVQIGGNAVASALFVFANIRKSYFFWMIQRLSKCTTDCGVNTCKSEVGLSQDNLRPSRTSCWEL